MRGNSRASLGRENGEIQMTTMICVAALAALLVFSYYDGGWS